MMLCESGIADILPAAAQVSVEQQADRKLPSIIIGQYMIVIIGHCLTITLYIHGSKVARVTKLWTYSEIYV